MFEGDIFPNLGPLPAPFWGSPPVRFLRSVKASDPASLRRTEQSVLIAP